METQMKIESGKKMKEIEMQKITPFLWFNNMAEEAVNFYNSIFRNPASPSGRSKIKIVTRYGEEGAKASGRKKGSVMTIAFEIEGQEFAALNGGPVFEINPSISFFVNCNTVQEIDSLWMKLSEGGSVLMELDKYPFSEKYGWVQDKFGVSWQLILPGREQKIAACFMFAGNQHKKAEEAINFYISVFNNCPSLSNRSEIIQLERYKAGQGPEGSIIHAKFTLNGQEFIAMDSHMEMPINFNPAISLVVNCENQEEIDYFWEKLSDGGDERAQQCGWLQDKYGISWQITPHGWAEMMRDSDPEKMERVMHAVLQMKKIDIKTIMKA